MKGCLICGIASSFFAFPTCCAAAPVTPDAGVALAKLEALRSPAQSAANAPLAMLPQYVFNLRRYEAIAIDVGDRDGLREDARQLHRMLVDAGVSNTFEVYSGDHVSAIADRFQNHVLPFFSRHLASE